MLATSRLNGNAVLREINITKAVVRCTEVYRQDSTITRA